MFKYKKARMFKSQRKATLIVFFDIRGIVHREYDPERQNVLWYLVRAAADARSPCAIRTR